MKIISQPFKFMQIIPGHFSNELFWFHHKNDILLRVQAQEFTPVC